MKKWMLTVWGWVLIAFAVWKCFALTVALPANGYELRFGAPLTAPQTDALVKSAEELGLTLALWKEDSVTLGTDLGRSSAAQRISVYGSPSLCFPASYLYGSAPGAGQPDGCGISAGLADALFGSREVVGLALVVAGGNRRVTGVVEGEEAFLICPEGKAADAGYTAASLEIRKADNPRGRIQSLLQSAGLSENDTTLLPTGTLRQLVNAAAWIPLAVAALILAYRMWGLLPLGTMARQAAGFALLLAAALALPRLLGALPRWLVPSRWSDMAFWMDLGRLVRQSLLAFISLTDTMRDHLLGTQLLGIIGCLLGLLSGALLLGLGNPGEKGLWNQ